MCGVALDLINNYPNISSSLFLDDDVDDSIRERRINRISVLLESISTMNEKSKRIFLSVLSEALQNENADVDSIIMQSEKFCYKFEQEESKNLVREENYQELLNKYEQSQDDYKNLYANFEVLTKEKNEKEEKITELDHCISELKQNLEKYSKINELQEYETQLNRNIGADELTLDQLKKQLESVENSIAGKKKELDKINEEIASADATLKLDTDAIAKKASSVALNSYLSKELMDSAEKLYAIEESNKFKVIAQENYEKASNINRLSGKELSISIYNKIKQYRNYSYNDIVNLMICMCQNFIVILSGEPGTGKTSICKIIAHCLGLDGNNNRFVSVSVEKGWSTKRDFIGYYNPLTKRYDKSNSRVYDALMTLNEENDNSMFPYVILLDEANLSPIEHYWSEFMGVADKTVKQNRINIGTNDDVIIPETLHFLATVNNDQTTETISPRLIDRSWVITLPQIHNTSSPSIIDENDTYSPVLWSDFKETFGTCHHDNPQIDKETALNKIYTLFEDNKIVISERVRQSIKNYILVAQDLMDPENSVNPEELAFDLAILQKLLPKISGHISELKVIFDGIKAIWKDEKIHSELTLEAISRLENSAQNNMGYCKFIN